MPKFLKNWFGGGFRPFKKEIYFLTFSIIGLLCFVILFYISTVQYINKNETSNYEDTNISQYRIYLRKSSDPHTSLRGIVSSGKQELVKGSSAYYRDEETGNHVLISKFGTREYECTGTCSCQPKDDDRRIISSTVSNTGLLKRSIFFLVATITGFSAYQKAREYFRSECVSQLHDSCLESSIESVVDTCEPITDPNNIITQQHPPPLDEEEEDQDIHKYFCKGHCVINGRLRVDHTKNRAKEFGCHNLRIEGEIKLDARVDKNKNARHAFMRLFMTNFCRESSQTRYLRKSPSGIQTWLPFAMCVGSKEIGYRNPSVHCVQTSPKPLNKNARKFWEENLNDFVK